jgi:hypothetical protein
MVIHNLDLRGTLRCPNKTNTELAVDPDRVLSLAITRQRFQAVARRRRKIAKIFGGIEIAQFAPRHFDEFGRKTLRALAVEDGFSGLATETSDRRFSVSLNDTMVNGPYQQRYSIQLLNNAKRLNSVRSRR